MPHASPHATPTVLYVEDDDSYAEIVRLCMEQAPVNHRLVHAPTGQEALDYVFRQGRFADADGQPAPDLILLDIRMPGMTGFEVLHALRHNPDTAYTPVVMLTSSESPYDIEQAYREQANSVLIKPMTYTESQEMLNAVTLYWLSHNHRM